MQQTSWTPAHPQLPYSFCIGRNHDLELLRQQHPWKQTLFVGMQQVHGGGVAHIDDRAEIEQLIKKNPIGNALTIPDVDGLVTTLNNVALVVRTADCVPVLMHHPAGVSAAAHAGRRGTNKSILSNTLKLFIKVLKNHPNYHTHADTPITIWFGPHICANCYQIDKATNRYYDLNKHNKEQLTNLLSLDQFRLITHGDCTLESPHWHSYRQTGAGVHMNYAGVLNPNEQLHEASSS